MMPFHHFFGPGTSPPLAPMRRARMQRGARLCLCEELCGEVVLIRRLPGEMRSVAVTGSYTMSGGSPPRPGLAHSTLSGAEAGWNHTGPEEIGWREAHVKDCSCPTTTFTAIPVPA